MSRTVEVGAALLGIVLASACKEKASAPVAVNPPPGPAATQDPGAPPPIDRTTPLPDPLPDIAARVNGQIVPTENVRLLAENNLLNGTVPKDQRPFAYRQALNQFVIRELMFQEAMVRGITPDDQKIAEAENKVRAEYKEEKEWKAFLAKQGLTIEKYRAELRTQYTVNTLTMQEFEKLPQVTTDLDLKRYYDEHPAELTLAQRVRISHILIRTPKGGPPAANKVPRARAETLLAEIRAGADFAKIAEKHSEDPGSSGKGGALDPFAKNQLPPELAPLGETALALQPGQVGDLVETPAGFHIVKLHERLPDEVVPFETVKEDLRNMLLHRKRNEHLQVFVNGLRAKAKIETYL